MLLLFFSRPVMSYSLRSHGLQHTRPPCLIPLHLPEFAQVHVHLIDDAFQTSHPLTPSSPYALDLYQSQGLFQ